MADSSDHSGSEHAEQDSETNINIPIYTVKYNELDPERLMIVLTLC